VKLSLPPLKPSMKTSTWLPLLLAGGLLASIGARAADAPAKYTIVIVHGATAGGWEWKKVGEFLAADGHTVYRPTLTGLGERVHLASPNVNLETHINDVVNTILIEDAVNDRNQPVAAAGTGD
jgi:alpha-beta hydrolase superfamily lysophospholipase